MKKRTAYYLQKGRENRREREKKMRREESESERRKKNLTYFIIRFRGKSVDELIF